MAHTSPCAYTGASEGGCTVAVLVGGCAIVLVVGDDSGIVGVVVRHRGVLVGGCAIVLVVGYKSAIVGVVVWHRGVLVGGCAIVLVVRDNSGIVGVVVWYCGVLVAIVKGCVCAGGDDARAVVVHAAGIAHAGAVLAVGVGLANLQREDHNRRDSAACATV